MNELIKAFVFIRQALMVTSVNKTYKTWYLRYLYLSLMHIQGLRYLRCCWRYYHHLYLTSVLLTATKISSSDALDRYIIIQACNVIFFRYSDTFGVNTVLKTGQNVSIFKYFMQCLTQLIPREPKETLQVHLQSSVRAPMHCNSLIFDYKSLGRLRLEELKQGVHIKFVSL